jgi:curved DNA-binding protein
MTPSDGMTADEALGLLGLTGPASPETVADAFRGRLSDGRADQGALRKVIEAYGLVQSLHKRKPETAVDGAVDEPKRNAKDILNISINEALTGVKRRIRLPDGSRAPVNLPAGLRTDDVIRLKRLGGDKDAFLKIRIGVEPHRSVEGHDVKLVVAVDRRVLGHGGQVQIETPDGPHRVWVRSTFNEGETVRLRGRGLPARGDHPAGDLLVLPVGLEAAAPTDARAKLERFAAAWAA